MPDVDVQRAIALTTAAVAGDDEFHAEWMRTLVELEGHGLRDLVLGFTRLIVAVFSIGDGDPSAVLRAVGMAASLPDNTTT